MIDIYATYIKSGNSINTGRVKIQEIPAASESAINLLNPTVKGDFGNAESMDFSVLPGTTYYDAFIQMRTYIRVDYGTDTKTTIFYGRVLTISEGHFGERKIHCEGALAFLNDSYYPGKKESERKKLTIEQHIKKVLNNHNSQVNDSNKSIYIGEVPGNYTNSTASSQRISNKSRKFGSTSWSTSKSVLEDLKSHYGGAFRIRYQNNRCYLDWYNHYYKNSINSQIIRSGINLLDLTKSTEVSNIFTAVIPIGKSSSGSDSIYITDYRTDLHSGNYLTVPQVTQFYSEQQLNSGYHTLSDYQNAVTNYGLIFKTVEFEEADTQEKLLNEAAEWIKDNYQGGVTSFSVKAIDLFTLGEATDQILLGDRVSLTIPQGSASGTASTETTITRTCISASYDLFNPENNQYTFGIPANALSKTYGASGSTKKKSSTYSGTPPEEVPEPEDDQTAWVKAAFSWMSNRRVWYKSTGYVSSGPRSETERDGDGNLIWGPGYNTFWHPYHDEMQDGETIYELWSPSVANYARDNNGNMRPVWNRDSSNRPTGTWTRRKKSALYKAGSINNTPLYYYIQDEYDFDLKTQLSVKMPSVITTEEGDVEIFGGNGTVPVLEYSKDLEVLNIFDKDGETVGRIKTEDGDYLFVQMEPDPNNPGQYRIKTDDQGNPIYVSMRNLQIQTINTERKVGWVVREDNNGDLSFNSENSKLAGEISLSIETFNQGKLVVARTTGDLVYLGTQEIDGDQITTSNLTAASLNHMDAVCGDVEYRNDPNTGVPYLYIKTGGGMRVGRTEGGVTSEFGVYDEGNLTGGIIIKTINGGGTSTRINGNIVYIGGDPSKSLDAEISDVDRELLNQGLTITNIDSDVTNIKGRLNAAEATIGRIEANYITSDAFVAKYNIHAGNVTASHYYIDTGVDSESGTYDLRNCVAMARITEDANTGVYTLHLYNSTGGELTPPAGYNLNFRKASSETNVYLRGVWSGAGQLTVTAHSVYDDQQTNVEPKTWYLSLGRTGATFENADGSTFYAGSVMYVPIWSYYGPQPPIYENTGFRVRVPLSAGELITQNGIYTHMPSKNAWGMSSVNVNVPNNYRNISLRFKSAGSASGVSYYVEAIDSSNGTVTPISGLNKYYQLGMSGNTITIQNPDTGTAYSETPSVLFSEGTLDTSTGQRTVGLIQNSAFIHSIVIDDYNSGKTAEAATLTVAQPTNNVSGAIDSDETKITVTIKASAWTSSRGSSNAVTNTNNFVLARGSYTNSSSETHRCVILRQGSSSGTVIGRIDTQQDYTDGVSSGRSTEASTITVSQPTNSVSGDIGSTEIKTTVTIKASAWTSSRGSSNAVTNTNNFVLAPGLFNSGNRCVILRQGSSSGTVIGRISTQQDYIDGHTQGVTDGYANGWGAAYSLNDYPRTNTSTNTFSVSWPNSTVNGEALTRTYAIVAEGNNAYVRVGANGTGATIAQCSFSLTSKTIDSTGTFIAGDEGYLGYSSVTVSGLYKPSDLKLGLSSATVQIQNSSGTKIADATLAITANWGSANTTTGKRNITIKAGSTAVLTTELSDYRDGYIAALGRVHVATGLDTSLRSGYTSVDCKTSIEIDPGATVVYYARVLGKPIGSESYGAANTLHEALKITVKSKAASYTFGNRLTFATIPRTNIGSLNGAIQVNVSGSLPSTTSDSLYRYVTFSLDGKTRYLYFV